MSREFDDPLATDPLTQRSMLSGQKKNIFHFRCCEFVIIPNSKVCRSLGAFAVGNNFGSAFLLGDCMHGPICFGRIIRNANNMPKLFVHFGFLYNSDVGQSRPVGEGGGTSTIDEEDSLTMVSRREA